MDKDDLQPADQAISEHKTQGEGNQHDENTEPKIEGVAKAIDMKVVEETANTCKLTGSPETSENSSSEKQPSQQLLVFGEKDDINSASKRLESFPETYDVITGTEVQDLTGWESIHKESLSEIPPIDHGAINDLESRAKDVASNLDHLLGTLATSLKSLSVISVQSVDAYKTSIQNIEDTVDESVKNMYTLIAKCEELNSHMGPLYTIAAQIKDIKRTLDVFESVCK